MQPPPAASPPPPDNTVAVRQALKRESRKRARASRKHRPNTSVYVTGLPADATESELAGHFSKCGILLLSTETGQPRIKLYRREDGSLKGDALVTYAMEASVENAVLLLDGVGMRDGDDGVLRVERASFEEKEGKGESKRRKTVGSGSGSGGGGGRRSAAGFKSRDLVAEALSWAEEGQEERKGCRIVILKNVFDGTSSDTDYQLITEDMQEGCEECGAVERVTVFERSMEGAVAVKFTTMEACVKCVRVMNGRWYDGRKLEAEFYDGVTDYRYKETEADREERDKKWQQWLEQGDDLNTSTIVESAQEQTRSQDRLD